MIFLLLGAARNSQAGNYSNFTVSVYIPVGVVRSFEKPDKLAAEWERLSNQVKIDKVYIEVQRDRQTANDELLERVKQFFLAHGVRVAGGMALSAGGGGQFQSFCYTDPADRAFIKNCAELAARHFDELIQDDFFFVTTKYDSDIAAKGNRSWTQFRLDLMDKAARDLIIRPARAVNPHIKLVIKFPNWYEHFPGLGFDLAKEPMLFDGIYTGTETRDPVDTDQHLQQYESYLVYRFFENIKPGGNGGGWLDTFDIHYVDRYAEQLWDTAFAKAPEITLFEWSSLSRPAKPEGRENWAGQITSFNWDAMVQHANALAPSQPALARVAGYSLDQVDGVIGKLGKPIGVKSYKPFQSTGEDFIHNYFGMLGIPVDLASSFPTNAEVVLLAESAAADPKIIPRIKGNLRAGKSVIITSGLLRALQGRGIEDIVEVRYTDRKVLARDYACAYGAGGASTIHGDEENEILLPDIRFLTNDSWALARALAHGSGYPLLLMDRYSKGVLYIWTIPENLADLYRLPPPVTSTIKDVVMKGFPVRLDGPAKVALFTYDNQSCVVESYLAQPVNVTLTLSGSDARLHDLLSGETMPNRAPTSPRGRNNNTQALENLLFEVTVPPHSYRAFSWAGDTIHP